MDASLNKRKKARHYPQNICPAMTHSSNPYIQQSVRPPIHPNIQTDKDRKLRKEGDKQRQRIERQRKTKKEILPVCVFVYLSVFLTFNTPLLSLCLSLSVCLYVCACFRRSLSLSLSRSLSLSLSLSLYVHLYLPVYLCVYLFISFSFFFSGHFYLCLILS